MSGKDGRSEGPGGGSGEGEGGGQGGGSGGVPPARARATGVPAARVVEATNHWIDTLVVGLGLCPFAAGVLERRLALVTVVEESEAPGVLQRLSDAADALLAGDERDATTLLVVPDGFGDFDDYLDLLALAEDLLADLGHEGALQIASFHPDYRFEGAPPEDPAHATNRSPFPMLQILQEDSVSRALDRHPDPDGIPVRNVERLRALGTEGSAGCSSGAAAGGRCTEPTPGIAGATARPEGRGERARAWQNRRPAGHLDRPCPHLPLPGVARSPPGSPGPPSSAR